MGILGTDYGGRSEGAELAERASEGQLGRTGHRRGVRPLQPGQGDDDAAEEREARERGATRRAAAHQ